MKKLFITLLLFPIIAISQKEHSISTFVNLSMPSDVGIVYEFKGFNLLKNSKKKENQSTLIHIAGSSLEYKENGFSTTGTGYSFGIGKREYLGKEKKGWYFENSTVYSSIEFSDFMFSGTYSYYSLFNSNVGYKTFIGKNINIEPFIGYMWKWEIKGKGDIDNKNIDNLVFRAGFKLGYSF